MPEIAVIVPAHIRNEQQKGWLLEAVKSVFDQSFKDWELCVVDDASPIRIDSSVRLDQQSGPGAARNAGVKHTTAPWLVFLDADDRLTPFALTDMYAAKCECATIYGDLYTFGEQESFMQLAEFTTEQLKALTGPLPVTALHHRAAFEAVGGFATDLDGLEDIEYWIRLAKIGVCGQHLNAVTMEYRKHGGSRTEALIANNKAGLKATAERIRERHADIYQKDSPFTLAACKPCDEKTKIAVKEPDNVEIRYIGLRQASFGERGPSKAEYLVEGKGAYLHIDPRDLQYFLNKRRANLPEYERVVRNRVTANAPVPPVPTRPMLIDIAPLGYLPAITSLPTDQALHHIVGCGEVVDLRVWLAEEKASPAPRLEVLAALQGRAQEVLGAR